MDVPADMLATSIVSEKETIEYFSEGLKQAASAARELAIAQNHQVWADIAILCMELRLYGIKLASEKALTRQKTLQILDHRENVMSKGLDDKRILEKQKILLH